VIDVWFGPQIEEDTIELQQSVDLSENGESVHGDESSAGVCV
jgi:hypothetical protein